MADNSQPSIIEPMMVEIANYGIASVKRIYGDWTTPKPFVAACDRFIFTEILRKDETSPVPTQKTTNELKGDTNLLNLLRNATEDTADEDGWSYLAKVGDNIVNQAPEFDPRNYGYKKLGELIRAIQLFDIDERSTNNNQSPLIYIRDMRKS